MKVSPQVEHLLFDDVAILEILLFATAFFIVFFTWIFSFTVILAILFFFFTEGKSNSWDVIWFWNSITSRNALLLQTPQIYGNSGCSLWFWDICFCNFCRCLNSSRQTPHILTISSLSLTCLWWIKQCLRKFCGCLYFRPHIPHPKASLIPVFLINDNIDNCDMLLIFTDFFKTWFVFFWKEFVFLIPFIPFLDLLLNKST